MAKAQTKTASADDGSMQRTAERSVSVSASGSVSAEPDIAHISSGVIAEAATAREALTRNTAAMKAVIDGLKGHGIEARDIQTVAFNIEPRHESKAPPGGTPQITGYRVVNQVRVIVRQLDRLGEVLDRLVTLGANQMHGLSFEVSGAEKLKDEARKVAMANALRRARLLAEAAGAEVGRVLAICEGVANGMPRGGPMARAAMLESVPIERGSQTLEVHVSATWALV